MTRRHTLLAAVVLASALSSLFVGAAGISPGDVWSALLSSLGIGEGPGAAGDVVLRIRAPRVVGGLVVGAGLGIAGAALHGLFRNPIADPYLLGVSSGAGFGFVMGSVLSTAGPGSLLPVLSAVLGGIGVVLLVRRINNSIAAGDGLVLMGVALGFSLLALTLVLIFAVSSPRLPTFAYFVFGSLGVLTWQSVGITALVVAVGSGVVYLHNRPLDLISLGNKDAMALGVDVPGVSRSIALAVGVIVGSVVAAAGVIGFVGLLGPYLARVTFGVRHRLLIPGAALYGGLIIVLADLLVRGLAGNVEVPIGVITAAVGGPALVWLLLRRRWW